MFKKKKDWLNTLCWFLPLQIGIIFLSKNIQASEQGLISGIMLIVISYFLKTYLDNKSNIEFYTQLVEDNRKIYKNMLDGLREEKYKSFNENINMSIKNFSNDLIKFLQRQEAMHKND